ncbi:MAG TPA: glycosyltransferase family A protein [Pseudonocardiaceae bacterium]|nr:glycosyltransferase family A protein [Pseudonocardiaceae bacterium]
MVTKDRPAFAARAIRCFADQRYPVRDLVIVCQGTSDYRRPLAGLAHQHGISNIAILDAAQDMSLGALRNRALDAAGDLVCIWDDDCSHPDRLTTQTAQLIKENSPSCFLGEHLQTVRPHVLLDPLGARHRKRATHRSPALC